MGKNWFMFVAMSLGTEFAVMSASSEALAEKVKL